jgi:unsaturated rhamnogalacturonyl hydrolase
MKRISIAILLCILFFTGLRCKTPVAAGPDLNAIPGTLNWSDRMALTVLKKNPWMLDTAGAGWGYTQGLILYALQQLGEGSKDPRYRTAVRRYGRQMIDPNGAIKGFKLEEYNLDNINAGKLLFGLYAETGDERYRKALDRLRDQLRVQPRTSEGGYWHKEKYPWQMWLDGAYMATPFLAQYSAVFNDPKGFDEAALQLLLMEKHLLDAKTGLLYHGWDEKRVQIWANKQTGVSPNFWGRAIGWYAMALVDALDHFPTDHPQQRELVRILKNLAPALKNYQHPTGLWYQVVDQGDRAGNYLEGSASAMFVYALAKGVRKGYLDASYLEVARKGFSGLTRELVKVQDGGEAVLTQVCEVAGLSADRDGSYEYYVKEKIRPNDPKGTGPFILAALELKQ